MIRFKSITLRNFLSFGNVPTTINLEKDPLTLIMGKNLDKGDSDKERNGVGKTSVYHAIHFSLYGKAIGNSIKLSNVPNKINLKNCYVKLEFEKDGKTYVIERGRNPNFLKFQIGDRELTEDESQGDSKRTQDAINKVIGFDDTIFTQIILMTTYIDQFLNYGTPQQKVILEEILGISHLSLKAEILKEKIKDTKTSLQQASYELDTNKKQNIVIKENAEKQLASLQSSSHAWTTQHLLKIKEYTEILAKLNVIDINEQKIILKNVLEYNEKVSQNKEKEEKIKKINSDIIEKQHTFSIKESELKALQTIDITKEIEHINLKAEYDRLAKEIDTVTSALKNLQNKKNDIITNCSKEEKTLAELLKVDIQKEKDAWVKNEITKKKQEEYNEKVKKYEQNLADKKIIQSQIDKNSEFISLNETKAQKSFEKSKEIQLKINNANVDIEKIKHTIEHIDSEGNFITCPTCGQKIVKPEEKQALIVKYNNDIKSLENDIVKYNNEYSEIIKDVSALVDSNKKYQAENTELKVKLDSIPQDKPTEENFEFIETYFKESIMEITLHQSKIDTLKNSIEEKKKNINEIDKQISEMIVPKQIDIPVGTFKYLTLEECYSHTGKIEKIEIELNNLKNSIEELEKSKKEIIVENIIQPDTSKLVYKSDDEITKHISEVSKFNELLKKENAEINPYEKTIKEFSIPQLLPEDTDKVMCLETLLKHQDFLLDLLTKPTSFIRKSIIESALPFLNAKIKYYLNKMNSLPYVEFNDDMTVTIIKNGDEYSFGNLSMGERSRISIALELSFRDVWESLNYPINLLCIDELLDNGLDTAGVESVIELLGEMKDRNVFLISHREELAPIVSHTLYVYMKHGFSEIEK